MRISIQIPSIYPDAMNMLYYSWIDTGVCEISSMDILQQGYRRQWDWTNSQTIPKSSCPSMFFLRDRLWHNSPKADYYMMGDDNMIFQLGAKEYLAECLDWMDKHPDFGFMSLAGFFGSYAKKDEMHFSNAKIWNINKGLIIRGGIQPFPEGALALTGGLEDLVSCYWILEQGYLPAKRFLAPVKHVGLPARERLTGSSWIHRWDVWESNAIAFIRERYHDPKWSIPKDRADKKRFPHDIQKGKMR